VDDETRDLITKISQKFIARRDVVALQNADGSWRPEQKPFKMGNMREHLEGKVTLGHYLVDPDGDKTKLFAFDIDIKGNRDGEAPSYWLDENKERHEGDMREAWNTPGHPAIPYLRLHLRCLAEGLGHAIHRLYDDNVHVVIADSGGKGLHVYGLTGEVDALEAKTMAEGVLQTLGCFEAFRGNNFWRHTSAYENLEIEVFPKQTTLQGKEYGNLMRLPLGINRKTGRVSRFLAFDNGFQDEWNVMPPLQALGGALPWPE
jgi:hypothetical protein